MKALRPGNGIPQLSLGMTVLFTPLRLPLLDEEVGEFRSGLGHEDTLRSKGDSQAVGGT